MSNTEIKPYISGNNGYFQAKATFKH